MARYKKEEEIKSETTAEEAKTEQTPETTETEETKEVATEKKAPETTAEEAKTEKVNVEAVEPNETVLPILKCFSAYETLYINKIGGVFTPDTPADSVGKAVLYKNPYFNK